MSRQAEEFASVLLRKKFNVANALESFAYITQHDDPKAHQLWSLIATLHDSSASRDKNALTLLQSWYKSPRLASGTDFAEKLFLLLVSGQTEAASRECAAANEWTYKSAVELNNIPLLRETSAKITMDPSFDAKDRAIYGFLCGDFDSVASLCDDWLAKCICYLNAKIKQSEFGSGSVTHFPPLKPALQVLADSNPWHQLFAAVIAGQLPELIKSQAEKVNAYIESGAGEAGILQDAVLLQTIAHLAILVGVTPETEVVVEAYIEQLCLSRTYNAVPIYGRYCSNEAQRRVFVDIIARIHDKAAREELVERAQECEVQLSPFVSESVSKLLSRYLESLPDVDPKEQAAPSDDDKKACCSIEWLELLHMWSEEANQTLDLVRGLLSKGYLRTTQYLFSEISIRRIRDMLPPQTDVEVMAELQQHRSLIVTFEAIDDCNGATEKTAADLFQVAFDKVLKLGGYLENRGQERLRATYVPFAYFELFKVMQQGQRLNPRNAEKIMELAMNIAKPGSDISQLFIASNSMPQLMSALAYNVSRNWSKVYCQPTNE